MFSGIVSEIAQVIAVDVDETSRRARIQIEADMFGRKEPAVRCGDSIAVSGVCLTVTALEKNTASFDLATETREQSTLNALEVGSRVNLEESLRLGDRLDGHMVQGHVDATSSLISLKQEDNTWRCAFSMSEDIRPLVAHKGSITIDGVSLTVAEVSQTEFVVCVIPYTWDNTLFSEYSVGQVVNIETDCVARYLSQLAAPYLAASITQSVASPAPSHQDPGHD